MPGDRQVTDRGIVHRLIITGSALVAVALMVLPVAGAVTWYLAPVRPIDLLVYNSTVQTAERRQHRAVDLALTYFKVPFDANDDYVGSAPGGAPQGVWPNTAPDLALLVDTYGVYVDAEGNLDEDGTVRVSGTFLLAAARDLVEWAEEGTVIMGEFNILHEPTPPDVSETLQALFGIDATGWTGRAYDQLQDVSEPIRSLHDGPWTFEGPGIVLVSASVGDRVQQPAVVVLRDEHLERHAPLITGTPVGGGRHVAISYGFWFSLIQAQADAETTMWIELPVNEQGKAMLDAAGVPVRTPFVVRTAQTAYLAGNVAATSASFPTRRISGSLPVLQWLPNTRDTDVFYELYAPLMADLLEQVEAGA